MILFSLVLGLYVFYLDGRLLPERRGSCMPATRPLGCLLEIICELGDAKASLVIAEADELRRLHAMYVTRLISDIILLYICAPRTHDRVFLPGAGNWGAFLGQTQGAESGSGPAWVRSWPRGARNG